MSNVVIISEKHIGAQKVKNIDTGKVNLPFNVNKIQSNKIENILNKITPTLSYSDEQLKMKSFSMGYNKVLSADRTIDPSRITLSKTYLVTMKKDFVTTIKNFFGKIPAEDNTPIFDVKNEENLQQALQEVTETIPLGEISAALRQRGENLSEETPIENFQQKISNNPDNSMIYGGPLNAGEELQKLNNQQIGNMPLAQEDYTQQPNVGMTKTKVKKLKGNVLVIPIVLVWLAFVLIGTIKLVTNILS